MKKYYTYILINSLDNQPFYVGKGSGARMYQHIREAQRVDYNKRSVHCKILNVLNNKGKILYHRQDALNEEQALAEEKRLIALYGRKDINTGILCNLTEGGESTHHLCQESIEKRANKHRGMKRSEESKQRMKNAQIKIANDNRALYGVGVKPETIQKMSLNRKGKAWSENARKVKRNKPTAKPVIVYQKDTNKFIGEWESISLCAKELKCNPSSVWRICEGKSLSVKEYMFKYKLS